MPTSRKYRSNGKVVYVSKSDTESSAFGAADTQSNAVSESSVKIGDILSKDNGRNQIQFEVLNRNANGALIAVQESSFTNASRFAKGKTVVVDNAFLGKGTSAKGSKYKSVRQAPDYIREQVGIDISKYRNAASQQFEKRGQITIDISGMKKSERTKLATALSQKYSSYTGEQSGTWLFTIKKR